MLSEAELDEDKSHVFILAWLGTIMLVLYIMVACRRHLKSL